MARLIWDSRLRIRPRISALGFLSVMIVALATFLPGASARNLMFVDNRLNNWLTIEQIRERVFEDLPQGTPLVEINGYFIRNNIEYSYYEKTKVVLARIDNIWGGRLLIDKSAQIVIKINEYNRLESIEVKPIFTGP